MNILIRHTFPEEADALSKIAFSAKAHWGYPDRWMEIWKPQLTLTPKYFVENESWTAEHDNQPISFYTLEEKDGNGWIENLWVLPKYIGKGIGRQLFVHALSRARELGYSKLQLASDPNAVGFYEKIGMIKVGEHHYPIEGQTRILPVMEILL
jgi:GNAT superfamily N-acetyltransferase